MKYSWKASNGEEPVSEIEREQLAETTQIRMIIEIKTGRRSSVNFPRIKRIMEAYEIEAWVIEH